MKRFLQKLVRRSTGLKVSAGLLLTVTALWAKPVVNSVPFEKKQFVAGEFLIQYREHVTAGTAVAHSTGLGALKRTIAHRTRGTGPMHVAKVRAGQTVTEAIAEISQNPDVEFAQPNYIYHTTTAPNDPGYPQMWALRNIGQGISSAVYGPNNPGTPAKDIGVESAWALTTDCSSVIVAVIDTGVNYNHEDLASNMAGGPYNCPIGVGTAGCDFVGAGNNNPMDLHGHGTHVAGTIGAVGNNARGTAGVCWTARILAVRVMDNTGSGTSADILEGFNFAVATGAGNGNAKVVNMSLAGPSNDAALGSAIAMAGEVVVVTAAGNSAQDHNVTAGYPCDYPASNILCVAASDQASFRATFSDYDTNSAPAARKVDIAAPGVNVLSTYGGGQTILNESFNVSGILNYAKATSGTSFGYSSCNIGGAFYDMLLLPNNCTTVLGGTSTSGYAANTSSKAYKTYSLPAGADSAILDYVFTADTEAGYDVLNMNYKNGAGDPFAGGINLASGSGELNGAFSSYKFSLGACAGTAACSIGFQLTADFSGQRAGVGVTMLSITTFDKDVTDAYRLFNGTSMAAPHVAGIATLLRARNPDFTAVDTVNAILTGGSAAGAFASNTRTGMTANAFGSMKYIHPTELSSVTSPAP